MYLTQSNFRFTLKEIHNLATAVSSKIILTATLPPSDVNTLLNVLGLMSTAITQVIREPCIQKSIKYHLITIAKTINLYSAMGQVFNGIKNLLKPDGRGIIFFVNKMHCESFAFAADCAQYHADMTKEGKANAIGGWISARESQWLCATPGLAQGIDLPYVDYIIFCERPYNVLFLTDGRGRFFPNAVIG